MYIMLLSLYENALRKMYVQVVGAWSQMVIQCSSKPYDKLWQLLYSSVE